MILPTAPPHDFIGVVMLFVTTVAVGIAFLYSVRVVRHKEDQLRWALLVLLGTISVGNLFVLLETLDADVHPWIRVLVRSISTGALLWAVWPLICDSWKELVACIKAHLGS